MLHTTNRNVTFGLDLTWLFFFFCTVGESESESSSESVSEPEELSAEELLAWATGPLPFSSESLKHMKQHKRASDIRSMQAVEYMSETTVLHVLPCTNTTRTLRQSKLSEKCFSFPFKLKARAWLGQNNEDQSVFVCEVNSMLQSLKKIFSIFLPSLSLALSLFNLS